MWVRIHTQGDSQELLFGKQLASDSSTVLSSQAMTALWVAHFTGHFQGTDYRDTEQEQNSVSSIATHMVTAVTSLKMTGKYKVEVLFWKERA